MATITTLAIKVSANIEEVVSAVNNVAEQITELGEKIDAVSQKIGLFAQDVAKLAAGVPAVRYLGGAFALLAIGLLSVIKTAATFAVAVVVVAWLKGITFSAAAAQVALGMLYMTLLKLMAAFLVFVAIPVFIAMLSTAEAVNREFGKLTGTLTPMQTMIERCKDAWEKWSLLIANGTFDWLFNLIGLIALGLAKIADYLTLINDATRGWAAPLALVGAFLTYLVLMSKVFFSIWIGKAVVGALAGIWGWLTTLLAGQLALNAATFVYLSLITLGLAVVIALVVGFVTWLFSSGDATEKAAQKTEMLKNATDAYKNSLRETVAEHKKMLDAINKWNEAGKTPGQKAADRQAELQNAIDEPKKLQERINALQSEIENRKKLIANISDKEQAKSFAERNEEATKALKELQKIQSELEPLTEAGKKAWEAENLQKAMQDRKIDKYDVAPTAAEELARAKAEIEAMLKNGDIDEAKRDAMVENAQKEFEKNDEAMKLVKKFSDMAQTPVSKFEELSEQLESVREKLKPGEYEAAQKKLLGEMASGLGIQKYLDASDTLAGRQKTLADVYDKLAQYAQKSGMSENELAEARQRAAKDIWNQTEAGKALYGAMESLRPLQDRIDEARANIAATAKAMNDDGENITQEAIEKAQDEAEEKIRNAGNPDKAGKEQDNKALVRGSVAYIDYMRKDHDKDPLKSIQKSSERTNELLAENVTATKDMKTNLEKCFEVVK